MTRDLVLTVDAGNTRTKFGIFQLRSGQPPKPVALTGIANCPAAQAAAELRRWCLDAIPGQLPGSAVLAGSHPESRDGILAKWPFPNMNVRTITSYQQIPVTLEVEFPDRVGTDRILNAMAVAGSVGPGHACIVVDSGTATTIDLVTHGPVFRGGCILPGIRLSAHAMHDYTARLPLLDMDQRWSSNPTLPARNTEDAMLAGLLYGHLGAVRELVYRMCEAAAKLVGVSVEEELILTGGGGRFLQDHIPSARFVDCLALHGLAVIHSSAT